MKREKGQSPCRVALEELAARYTQLDGFSFNDVLSKAVAQADARLQ
jgi:hypothetical protein